MSSPEASPTKGLSSWWKQIKKHSNLSNESIDSTGAQQHLNISNVLTPSNNGSNTSFNRPTLNFKSRSFNAVRSNDEQLIRQQRDEFIASQKNFGFGNEVFGVPLEDSIKIAESLISVPSDDPDEFVRYGKIPLLIGKCGSFLKEKGLNVEGIFRVAGASRRVKELQYIFITPPEYGRKLNWDGYTVHDAASLFRRFLNNLPEPLVPLDLYEEFREPIKSRQRIINHIRARNDTLERRIRTIQLEQKRKLQQDSQDKNIKDDATTNEEDDKKLTEEDLELQKQKDAKKQKKIAKDLRNALKEYRILIDRLPEANKHLLYYLLDMLAMFSDNSKANLMPASNLAAIFQPSILSHPNHDLTPEEYALSQAVVEVLIEYSKRLLPDVKKFNVESKGNLAGSSRGSTINLAVRSSINGSRPYSRSLSSANGVPDSITKNVASLDTVITKTDKNTTSDNSSDEEEIYHPAQQEPLQEPEKQEQKDESLEVPKKVKSIEAPKHTDLDNWSSSPPPPSSRTGINISKKRPVSMFPGALTTDVERESRWGAKSPPAGDDFLNVNSDSKKGSWFSRLRSSSRSKTRD